MAKNFTEADLKNLGLKQNSDGSYSKAKTVLQPRDKIRANVMLGNIPAFVDTHPAYLPAKAYTEQANPNQLTYKWADVHVSLNDWYSSEHWTKRNKTKQFWHKFFVDFLPNPKPFFEKYSITLRFNSKLDPSNTITMIKLCEDTLQKEGVIHNDNMTYCKGVHIIPDETMKRFSYLLTIKNEL